MAETLDLSAVAKANGLVVDPEPYAGPDEAALPTGDEAVTTAHDETSDPEPPRVSLAKIVAMDEEGKYFGQTAFIGPTQQVTVELRQFPPLPFATKDGERLGGVVKITPVFTESSCDHKHPSETLDPGFMLRGLQDGTLTHGRVSSFFQSTSPANVAEPLTIIGALNNPGLASPKGSMTLDDLKKAAESGVIHFNDSGQAPHEQAALTAIITPGEHLLAAWRKGPGGETYVEPLAPSAPGHPFPPDLIATIVMHSIPSEETGGSPHVTLTIAAPRLHTGQDSQIDRLRGIEVLTMVRPDFMVVEGGQAVGVNMPPQAETSPIVPGLTEVNAVRRYLGVPVVRTPKMYTGGLGAATIPRTSEVDFTVKPEDYDPAKHVPLSSMLPGDTGRARTADPAFAGDREGDVPLVPAPVSLGRRLIRSGKGKVTDV